MKTILTDDALWSSKPKSRRYAAGAIVLFLLIHFAHAHEGHNHPPPIDKGEGSDAHLKAIYSEIETAYEKDISPIFQAKCAACHSTSVGAPWYAKIPLVGNWIENDRTEAKVHLEISKGFPFSGHGTVQEDLAALKKSIRDDSMPTRFYVLFHPASRLTAGEKKAILDWLEWSDQKLSGSKNPERQ